MNTTTTQQFLLKKPQYLKMKPADPPRLEIMIWSRTKEQADDIDALMKDVLTEYGYDPNASSVRSTFRGSWFIRYKLSKRASEIEHDLEVVLGSNNPNGEKKQISSSILEKLEKLNKGLEISFAIILAGGMLFANIGALRELADKAHEAFGAKQPVPTVVVPQVEHHKHKKHHIQQSHTKPQLVVKIPLSSQLALTDAQQNPVEFEYRLSVEVDAHLKSQGLTSKGGAPLDIPIKPDDLP